jgi:tricorn protease
MRRIVFVAFALAALLCSSPFTHAQTLHLFRSPSVSETQIAFLYADDVWTVSKDGGIARRLTSTANVDAGPYFSPDGRTIAYSARVGGVPSVYTIPAEGGMAKRITFHPSGDFIVGWTTDGRDLLATSMSDAVRTYFELYRIHADGSGLPERVPLPSVFDASMSPDGTHLAYNPWLQWEPAWKRYHGGQTQPVWIVDLKTLDLVKVPRENSNDTHPVWIGDAVYFLSDRNGPVTLFCYDLKTKAVKQLVENRGLDLKTLNGRGSSLVYEQFGVIHLYDIASGADHVVNITTDGDLPALEPHLTKIQRDEIQNAAISPTGVRAVLEAHGDIFTVPADKGDVRNLTDTSNAAEREPSWSPDGKRVAYFSDASGEYELYLRDQDGLSAPKIINVGADEKDGPTYYYSPRWSPDSKRILFSDKRLNLWYVDVDGGKPVKVDADLREGFGPAGFSASFSPDAKWILYARSLPNIENAAFLYSIESGKSTQITDGMSNVTNPVFDASGKYIFFTASTDIGPAIDGFGLGSLDRTTTASVYVAVLSKDLPSPIPPESGDEMSKADAEKKADADKPAEKADDAKKYNDKKEDAKAKPLPVVKIDLDGIQQRILALPIPARNYTEMVAGKPGILLIGESGTDAANPSNEEGPPVLRSVWRFDLEKRKAEDVLHGAVHLTTSFDGEKLLYKKDDGWFIAPISELNPGGADGTPGKALHLGGMEAKIDPRAEWKQMYRETWRIEREFFYDPNFHGLDLKKIYAKYEPYVDGLSSRSDLTYLQTEMTGELSVGHMFVNGPHTPDSSPKTGLLGANYAIDHDRYKFTHIVSGGNWNPTLYSPLTQPGVNVHEGDYLLAVNGVPLHATDNLYAAFEGLAGKQTTITVGANADGSGSHTALVVPTASEWAMREQEWIEGNIRKVDALSNGQVAYVYMPNTGGSGFDSFVRYFFAQVEKKAVIIDDRYNQGGDIADYVIDVLKRTPMLAYESRQGLKTTEPTGAIFGPKAMLINQNAGSGGDALPWLFRNAKLGPLVGVRTWGGLVGIGGYPPLLDGGSITAPRTALYGLHGEFEVENHGIAPDIEVEDDPKSVAGGHDPQLERAVQVVLEDLKAHPIAPIAAPPYPNYHKDDGLGVK